VPTQRYAVRSEAFADSFVSQADGALAFLWVTCLVWLGVPSYNGFSACAATFVPSLVL
jgi:hypothetical protein